MKKIIFLRIVESIMKESFFKVTVMMVFMLFFMAFGCGKQIQESKMTI